MTRLLLHCVKTENLIKKVRKFSVLTNLYSIKTQNQCILHNFHIQERNFSYETTVANLWKEISNSTPVAYLQDGLVTIHDTTGLPWWGSIILSTVLLRSVITFPFAVYQNKITSRIELCTLEMPEIVKELKKETVMAIKKFGWTEAQARVMYNRSLKKQWKNLIIRENCHPAKTMILLWIQMPLWICQSVAIRNLVYMLPNPGTIEAQITFTELTVGGFGWIPNLIEVDASFILPIMLGLVNLSIIELQTMCRTRPTTKFQKYATNFFRVLSIGMVPIAAQVPACLTLYWVTSSTFGLVQNLCLLSPNVRRFLRIPKTESELQDPYTHLQNQLGLRLKYFSFNRNESTIVKDKNVQEK